ncbi:MAG TPA: F420-0--gamma-glutamyl ligase, partial [Firmicutes bacterium]|nr:F420-0--gamma-glutamyl ligase [Bacillota bacterium]
MGRTRELRVNCGKRLAVEVGGRAYARIPIKTHVITAADDIVDVVQRYAGPLLHSEDMLVISEKVVSIAQQRAYP